LHNSGCIFCKYSTNSNLKEDKKEMEKIIKFIKDEDGLELSEYAVMGGLIVLGLVAAITVLHGAIDGNFRGIAGAVTAAS
jgi:pilus assembly protein Flp/PilA